MSDTTTAPAPEQTVPAEDGASLPAGEQDSRPETSPAESRNSSQMFEFSGFVHVGPGAKECSDAESGECDNPMHFHAWIRLPNQFQQKSLRDKAEAAKARKLRQLRDEQSDSYAVLDAEIGEMVREGNPEPLIDSIVAVDFLTDHWRAMRAVAEEEEFATIEEDRERLEALTAMSDEDRPEEEFEELQRHVGEYTQRVNDERVKMQEPLRTSLAEKTMDELAELVRENRTKGISGEAGEEAYVEWQWYICTLKPRDANLGNGLPSERVWASIDAMRAAPPEVIDVLGVAFQEIEAAAGRSLQRAADG
jgi:hypothetical protein